MITALKSFHSRRRISLAFVVILAVLVLGNSVLLRAEEPVRQRLLADFGWKFTKGDPQNAAQTEFDDAVWRKLNLPHDWSIEGPYSESAPIGGSGGYLPTGIGWDRRPFAAPELWRGRKRLIALQRGFSP